MTPFRHNLYLFVLKSFMIKSRSFFSRNNKQQQWNKHYYKTINNRSTRDVLVLLNKSNPPFQIFGIFGFDFFFVYRFEKI